MNVSNSILWTAFLIICLFARISVSKYVKNPAPDGHRCGVCPTYFQKICGFDLMSNSTYIFDNHCIMDLYNCLKGTEFVHMHYDRCLYFGNFAYVHGMTHEDKDYGEDGLFIDGMKKNQAGFW